MAKMKGDMAMMCPTGKCGPTCIILGLLAAAFFAGGLWLIVGGIMKQWSGMMTMTNVFLWYFGGSVVWCIGKMFKMKCCGYCRMM